MPADAEGEGTWVRCRIGWLRLPINQLTRRLIPRAWVSEIIMRDDGIGYDPRNLVALRQSRKNRLCIGTHGEGLKLAQAAVLRHDIRSSFTSTYTNGDGIPVSWRADSFFDTVPDVPGALRLAVRMAYQENPRSQKGSSTRLRPPPVKGRQAEAWQALVQEAFEIPTRFLEFYWGAEVHSFQENPDKGNGERYPDSILDLHPIRSRLGRSVTRYLYVKNTRIKKINTLFDYDLGLEEVDVDRRDVETNEYLMRLGEVLYRNRSMKVAKRILRATCGREDVKSKSYDEQAALKIAREKASKEDLEFWGEAFRRTFGKKAALSIGEFGADQDASLSGKKIVFAPMALAGVLKDMGAPLNFAKSSSGRLTEYVPESDLTQKEKAILAKVPSLNALLKSLLPSHLHGEHAKTGDPQVRVFKRIIEEDGKENTKTDGFKSGDETAVRRSCLSSLADFISVYAHEYIHWITDAKDYDPSFREANIAVTAQALVQWLERHGV